MPDAHRSVGNACQWNVARSKAYVRRRGPLIIRSAAKRMPQLKLDTLHRVLTDKTWLKCYVCSAWILDTVHEVLLLNWVYTSLVKDIGDLPALTRDPV